MAQLTQEIIDAAIEGFEAQKKRIDAQIAELRSLGRNRVKPETEEGPVWRPLQFWQDIA
jgi:hypothetical protein